MENNVVIITSVIHTVNKPFTYSKTRSVFSVEERIEQTKKTIESLREKMPGVKIYLFEQGASDIKETEIYNMVDEYKYIGKFFLVKLATESPFKGLGEVVGLLTTTLYLPKNFLGVFKISGRYFLNDNFNLLDWQEGNFISRKFKNIKCISTRLYFVSRKFFNYWRMILILSIPLLLLNRSIENILYYFIPKKYFKDLNALGLSGVIGINKNSVVEE